MGRKIQGLVIVLLMLAGLSAQATTTPVRRRHRSAMAAHSLRVAAHNARLHGVVRERRVVARSSAHVRTAVVRVRGRRRVRYYGERFTANSFADINNLTAGDVTAGEDPVVRAAGLWALGKMSGRGPGAR